MLRVEIKPRYSNNQLKELIKQENPKAIQYIYSRYFNMVESLIRTLGGVREDVEDVFQDALEDIVIQIRADAFKIETSFKSYFYIVCRNKWVDRLRQMSAEKNYHLKKLDDSDTSDTGDDMDKRTIEDAFRDSFKKLEQMCRTILMLSWEEYSMKEISRKIDYNYEAVKKRKNRCRIKLIEEIKKDPAVICIQKDREGIKNRPYG